MWDYANGTCLKTFKASHGPILAIKASTKHKGLIFAAAKKAGSVKVISLDPKTEEVILLHKFVGTICTGLELSSDETWLAFGSGEETFAFTLESKTVQTLSADEKFTRLSVHPEESCIAVGDAIGKIHLWYGYI